MATAQILVVEDEIIVALDIQARLQELGHAVVGIASSGEDAIRTAEDAVPDLALMDIRLRGEMDGIETAALLRERFDCPVIYLTSYGDEETLQRAKLTEPYGFLIKPFEERELHGTIEMALHRQEIEKRLRQQTYRLERVLATIPEGVALLDGSNRILMANQRARDDLLALGHLQHEGEIERVDPMLGVQSAMGSDLGVWQEILGEGLPPRVYEMIATLVDEEETLPAPDESNEWLMVLRDVTQERHIQQQLQLQERLAAIGQLAAGIAHDFNNILSGIMVFSEYIRMTEPALAPKSHARLEMIEKQSQRAASLIKQLLAFSRSATVDLQPLDLVPLLDELRQMLARLIPENIQVSVSCRPGEFVTRGDPAQIQHALMNLALNARDAMPDGGSFTIEMERYSGNVTLQNAEPDQNEWTAIRVCDTGMGISAENLPHIFEPFFTTKAPGRGSGLGLAQVYGIVRQHKGTIEVDSQPGMGTVFTLLLPASVERMETVSDVGPPAASMQGARQAILVVEDDANVRLSISDILEISGYRVHAVANGRAALEVFEEGNLEISLVLSDLLMPEMGGRALCEQLRLRGYDGAIIIMSGYVTEEVRSQLAPFDISDYLLKPLGAERVQRAVATVMASNADN
ncbi:MAG: response regulator [Caldilinea sp.]|nr:response regulator [Caldilineaceae bacterium]MCB9120329.1 response regulator [Caldilineaceae bacterium]MCO5208628.1 response regulator [Caldilinea sp.]